MPFGQSQWLDMIDLKSLRLFLAVEQAGGFSSAASVCHVSQPVLSRCIKELELELRVELFIRNGRGVELTDAGIAFREYAQRAVSEVDEAVQEMRRINREPVGDLVLGVPPTVGSIIVVPLVKKFKEKLPKARLRIVEVFSGSVAEMLNRGQLDAAILYNPSKTSTLAFDDLLTEELFLVGPANHQSAFSCRKTVSCSDLALLPLILPGSPHGLRLLVDKSLHACGVQPDLTVEADSLQAMVALVGAGLGFTILPFAAVRSGILDGKLKHWSIANPSIERKLVLATSTSRPSNTLSRMFVKLVRQEIQTLLDNGLWLPGPVPANDAGEAVRVG